MAKKYPEIYKSLDEEVSQAAQSCGLSYDQLADDLNVGRSNLYRMLNPYDRGASFPARLLNPFMRITGDYGPLKNLANRNGFLLVKIPRKALKKLDESALINNYQFSFNSLIKNLLSFFDQPTAQKQAALINQLTKYLEHTAEIRERIKKNPHQEDLFNE